MNDTNLTARQLEIIDLLDSKPLLGSELLVKMNLTNPISKATLMRDLGRLISTGFIKVQGQGKSTVYLSNTSRAIKPVNLEAYFNEGSNIRKSGPKQFNVMVFDLLQDIFTNAEIQTLNQKRINLSLRKATLDSSIFKREIERFTVEFAWKSSKIEGNTYSLLETEVLIKQMREAHGRTKYEATMILNHKYAVDYILNNPNEFKTLTASKVIKLHTILTKDLEIRSGIRNNPVAITGTDFIPLRESDDIKKALNKLVRLINKTEFPLAKSLLSLALIAYIQPFVDGNKRTSRTLANAILIAHDYYPLSYRNLDEVEYLKALLLFYETNNLYHLKRLLLDQFEFAIGNYFQS